MIFKKEAQGEAWGSIRGCGSRVRVRLGLGSGARDQSHWVGGWRSEVRVIGSQVGGFGFEVRVIKLGIGGQGLEVRVIELGVWVC